jgi:hypothetical protein
MVIAAEAGLSLLDEAARGSIDGPFRGDGEPGFTTLTLSAYMYLDRAAAEYGAQRPFIESTAAAHCLLTLVPKKLENCRTPLQYLGVVQSI